MTTSDSSSIDANPDRLVLTLLFTVAGLIAIIGPILDALL